MGESCHIKINYCETIPCGVGGECVNELLTYKCLCYYGYNGTNCKEVYETTPYNSLTTTVEPIVPDDPNVLGQPKQNEPIIASKKDSSGESKTKVTCSKCSLFAKILLLIVIKSHGSYSPVISQLFEE